MKAHPLQRLLKGAYLEPHSYSGRGMYGASCLAVEVSGMGEFLAKLAETCFDAGEAKPDFGREALAFSIGDRYDIVEALRHLKQDNMGHDYVLYFPGVPFTDNNEEEESDEMPAM